jgi:hypothetical protein
MVGSGSCPHLHYDDFVTFTWLHLHRLHGVPSLSPQRSRIGIDDDTSHCTRSIARLIGSHALSCAAYRLFRKRPPALLRSMRSATCPSLFLVALAQQHPRPQELRQRL